MLSDEKNALEFLQLIGEYNYATTYIKPLEIGNIRISGVLRRHVKYRNGPGLYSQLLACVQH
jgi:hypothetical protein